MTEICSSCQKSCHWANRTRKLCIECNHIRLHGETPKETATRQAKKYQEKLSHSKTKVNQVSDKQKKINATMSKVKSEVAKVALNNENLQCQGCMKCENLTRSHILSVAQRPDLQLNADNIEILCMNCHAKWESWDIEKMSSLISFKSNLRHIFDYDSETFYRLFYKIEDWLKAHSKETKQITYNRIKRTYNDISEFKEFDCIKFMNGKKRCENQCKRCQNL